MSYARRPRTFLVHRSRPRGGIRRGRADGCGTRAGRSPSSVGPGDAAECEVIDLGELTGDGALEAEGRWTTEDCDSLFLPDSDAHTYQFQLVEGDRIRIDLTSADGDPYLYLLAEDGTRITDNDDGGAGLNARIERDLVAGVYLVEATTVGGRGRGPADFTLSISHVAGCDPVHLGTLEPGVDLTASGSWTIDTCGARVVAEHPAYAYSFSLPRDGRVLIDLISEDGDPVLSLASSEGRFIGANDDGGGVRNSRIEQYLAAGTYLIEATTYLQRDLQPLLADFDLVVHLVDEEAQQRRFKLKIEATHAPDRVIAGQPFDVHYRVGNPGGGDLADAGGRVVLYVVAPRVFERSLATPAQWQAGVSYHSGARMASATSVAAAEVTPFAVTLRQPGPSWVFVAILAFNEAGEEIAFHGIWRNLVVLSGPTFGPVTVQADGADYVVEAAADADEDGFVNVSVTGCRRPGRRSRRGAAREGDLRRGHAGADPRGHLRATLDRRARRRAGGARRSKRRRSRTREPVVHHAPRGVRPALRRGARRVRARRLAGRGQRHHAGSRRGRGARRGRGRVGPVLADGGLVGRSHRRARQRRDAYVRLKRLPCSPSSHTPKPSPRRS